MKWKTRKLHGFSYSKSMANFEAFCGSFSSSTNLIFLMSDILYFKSYILKFVFLGMPFWPNKHFQDGRETTKKESFTFWKLLTLIQTNTNLEKLWFLSKLLNPWDQNSKQKYFRMCMFLKIIFQKIYIFSVILVRRTKREKIWCSCTCDSKSIQKIFQSNIFLTTKGRGFGFVFSKERTKKTFTQSSFLCWLHRSWWQTRYVCSILGFVFLTNFKISRKFCCLCLCALCL